jgi:hypothetical protein
MACLVGLPSFAAGVAAGGCGCVIQCAHATYGIAKAVGHSQGDTGMCVPAGMHGWVEQIREPSLSSCMTTFMAGRNPTAAFDQYNEPTFVCVQSTFESFQLRST